MLLSLTSGRLNRFRTTKNAAATSITADTVYILVWVQCHATCMGGYHGREACGHSARNAQAAKMTIQAESASGAEKFHAIAVTAEVQW